MRNLKQKWWAGPMDIRMACALPSWTFRQCASEGYSLLPQNDWSPRMPYSQNDCKRRKTL